MGKDERPCQPSPPTRLRCGEDLKNKVFLLKLLYYPCVVEQGGKNFPAAFDTCKKYDCTFLRSSRQLLEQRSLNFLFNLQFNTCL